MTTLDVAAEVAAFEAALRAQASPMLGEKEFFIRKGNSSFAY